MGNPSRQDFNAATAVIGPQEAKALDLLPLTATTVGVAVVSGDAEYSVEVTLDDINDPEVTPFWFTLEEFPTGSTTTKYGSFIHPWAWIRLNLVSLTGDVSFYIAQSFDTRS
jgi:hypothetical protein